MKKLVGGFLGIALSCVALTAYAGVMNGSFETGDLSGWSTLGSTSTVTGLGDYSPTDGAYAGLLDTSGTASSASIESALGLASGDLGTLASGNGTSGSLVYQSFYASAGTVISFDYLFATNELPGPNNIYNDFAFASILVDSVLTDIASVTSTVLTSPSTSGYFADSGWLTFDHTLSVSGLVTLGIGILDGDDLIVDSGLMIDNIKAVPEPSTLALLFLGLLGLALRQRRISGKLA